MYEELIDIYDENMRFIGIAPRYQAHQEGLWHMTFHCWIVSQPDKVWLQLRGAHVNHPHKLDISSAGHLKSGEKARDGIREIEKELGLKVDFENLNKLFTNRKISERPGYINREFTPTYLLETSQKISDLNLDPQEVAGLFEFNIEDLLNLFNGKVEKVFASGLLINEDGSYSLKPGSFGKDDFLHHPQDYYLKVFNIIKRYFAGSKNYRGND